MASNLAHTAEEKMAGSSRAPLLSLEKEETMVQVC